MEFSESFSIALGAMRANKIRTALTMLGVIIGVGCVIMLVSLGEGAKRFISNEFKNLGSNLLIVTPGKKETTGGPMPLSQTVHKLTFDDARYLEKRCSYIDKVAPIMMGTSLVKYKNRARDTMVLGVTYDFQVVRNYYADIGSMFSDADNNAKRRVCTIGRANKRELFRESNPLGEMIKIGDTKFRVTGIMQKKGVSLGIDLDDVIFIPIRAAEDLFDTDALFEILIKVKSEKFLDPAKEKIRELLIHRHDDNEDFTINSQAAMLSTLQNILDVFTYVLGGIAGISLLVGGIGIMNIMLVSVKERTREIGIRKAVGANKYAILIQFIIEAVTMSVAGGIVGICFGGIGILAIQEIIPSLPLHLSLWTISLAFSFSAMVGIFFGVYPAYKASELDPIDALRYE
jgi:putative ABC transport system permease protein